MSLNSISVFVKVVQAGSFSQAARLLGMPNTTVSAKVADLERRLGVTLIHRTTRKLHVTEAGAAYFGHCLRALEELQAAEQELATGKREPSGVLRLTAPVDIGHSILPQMVQAYLRAFPKMRVDLIVSNRVVDLVGEGVDLAIRAAELEDSSLIAKKMMPVRMSLWASPDYLKRSGSPQHPRDLSGHSILLHAGFQHGELAMKRGKEVFAFTLQGRVVADDFETLKQFALLGEGVGMIPDFLCEPDAKKGALVRVISRWEQVEETRFSWIYPAQKFVSPKVHAFIAAAESVVRKCAP